MSSTRYTPRHAQEAADRAREAQAEADVDVMPDVPGATGPGSPLDAPREEVVPEDSVPQGEQRAARSTAIMAAGTLVSRVLGLVRAALLTVAIGLTSHVADIFEVANSLPNVIYLLLVGGVFNVVLVPQLIKHAKDADRGADYTSRLMTLGTLVMLGGTVLVMMVSAPLMGALTRGWSPEKLQMGTIFALWCLPQVFFYGMYALVGQVLNANGRFGAYMWAPVLNNVVAIAAIGLYLVMFGAYDGGAGLAGWTPTQTLILAGGHTLGVVLQAVILFLPLRGLGLGLRPRFGWKGIGLKDTGVIALYTLVTMMVTNVILLLCQRYVTSATEARDRGALRIPGTEAWSPEMAQAAIPGVAAYNMAMLISVLPHSVFVLSLATVLFNRLARSMDAKDMDAVRRTTAQGLRAFTVPLMFSLAGIVVLAGPLGRVFGSTADTALVAGVSVGAVLLAMGLAVPFRSSSFYLLRVFYAAEDARTPMIVQVSASVLMLVLAFVGSLVLPLWSMALWVALASTLSYVYQFAVAHVLTVRRFGDYGGASVLRAHAQTGLAALASAVSGGAVVWLLGGYTGGFAWGSIATALITCALAAVVMAPVYLVVLRLMRMPELDDVLRPLAARVPALGRLVGSRPAPTD